MISEIKSMSFKLTSLVFLLTSLISANIKAEIPIISGDTVLLPPFSEISSEQYYFYEDTFGANLIIPSISVYENRGFEVDTALVQNSTTFIPAIGTCVNGAMLRIPVNISVPGRYKFTIKYRNDASLYSVSKSIFVGTGGYEAIHKAFPSLHSRGESISLQVGVEAEFWNKDTATFLNGFASASFEGIKAIPEVYSMIATGGTTVLPLLARSAEIIDEMSILLNVAQLIPDAHLSYNILRTAELDYWMNQGEYDLAIKTYHAFSSGAVGAITNFRTLFSNSTITVDRIEVQLILEDSRGEGMSYLDG